MKETNFTKNYVPYVPMALEEQGIDNYVICSDGKVLVPEQTSNRKLKICRRRAWAFYMSGTTGVRYLTREDADKTVSGVIPDSERRFFGLI